MKHHKLFKPLLTDSLSSNEIFEVGTVFESPSNQISFHLSYFCSNTTVMVKLFDYTTEELINKWETSNSKLDVFENVTQGHKYFFEYNIRKGGFRFNTLDLANNIYSVYSMGELVL